MTRPNGIWRSFLQHGLPSFMEVVSPASMEKAKDTPIGLPQSQYTDFLAPATTTSPSRPSFHKRLSAPSSPLKREEQSNQTQSPDNGSDGVSTTKTLIRRFSKPPTKGESDTNSPTRVNRSKSERIGAIVKRFSRDGSFINTCETEVGGSDTVKRRETNPGKLDLTALEQKLNDDTRSRSKSAWDLTSKNVKDSATCEKRVRELVKNLNDAKSQSAPATPERQRSRRVTLGDKATLKIFSGNGAYEPKLGRDEAQKFACSNTVQILEQTLEEKEEEIKRLTQILRDSQNQLENYNNVSVRDLLVRLKSEVISKRRYLMKLRKEVQEIDEMALAEENDSDSDSEDDSGYGNSENSEDDEEEYDTDEYDNMSLEGVKEAFDWIKEKLTSRDKFIRKTEKIFRQVKESEKRKLERALKAEQLTRSQITRELNEIKATEKLREEASKVISEILRQAENTQKSLAGEIEKQKNDVKRLDEELGNARKELERAKEEQRDATALREENAMLEKKLKGLGEDFAKLEEEMKERKNFEEFEKMRLQEEVETLKDELEKRKANEEQQLKKVTTEAVGMTSDMQNIVRKLEEDVEREKALCCEVKDELQRVKEEAEEERKKNLEQVKKIEAEAEDAEIKRCETEKELSKEKCDLAKYVLVLEAELKSSKDQAHLLQQQILGKKTKYNAKVNSLREEHEQKIQSEVAKTNSIWEERVAQLESNISESGALRAEHMQQKIAHEEKIQALQHKIEMLNSESAEAIQSLREESARAISELEAKISHLQKNSLDHKLVYSQIENVELDDKQIELIDTEDQYATDTDDNDLLVESRDASANQIFKVLEGLSDMHPKEKQIILKYVKEITAENEKSRDEMREVKKNSQLVYDKLIKLQVLLKKEKMWQEDHTMPHCSGCGKGFGFLTFRHHCRICGQIFCGDCCNNFIMCIGVAEVAPPSYNRKCNTCIDEFRHLIK